MITSKGLERLGFDRYNDYVLQNDGAGVYIAEWKSVQPQPSEAEIEAAHAEWQTEHDSQEYARNRATAYAPLGEQLDMQYHDQQDGTTTWADHVTEIKRRYPR